LEETADLQKNPVTFAVALSSLLKGVLKTLFLTYLPFIPERKRWRKNKKISFNKLKTWKN